MRLLYFHEIGAETGRRFPALQPVFTRDKQREIERSILPLIPFLYSLRIPQSLVGVGSAVATASAGTWVLMAYYRTLLCAPSRVFVHLHHSHT